MTNTQDYITSNKERFLNELLNLLRIPSVSADSNYNEEVVKCANTLAEDLKKIGLDNVEICQTKGHPIVYGEKILDDALPTVLVYGHYDVQPADPIDLWTNPPNISGNARNS